MWSSRKSIQATMPDALKQQFSDCRVIADCTKCFFFYTNSEISRNKSLSNIDYTFHIAFKGLTGISLAGMTTFVSDLWGGRIS